MSVTVHVICTFGFRFIHICIYVYFCSVTYCVVLFKFVADVGLQCPRRCGLRISFKFVLSDLLVCCDWLLFLARELFLKRDKGY